MNLRLSKGQLKSADIEAISSKSFVHRLLIAAALSDNSVTINTNIISKDMEATVGVLRALGASIDVYGDKFVIKKPVTGADKAQETVNLDCIESGSTARFIMPLAVHLTSGACMTGSGKLPERPFTELVEVLKKHGADIDGTHLPLKVSGTLNPGEYEIAGNVSSQYISGLMFVLPILEGPSTIKLTTNLESSGYVDMTLDVLKLFGIIVNRSGNVFSIPGGQRYHGPSQITAEGDWSNGAYLLAFAHMAKLFNKDIDINVTGLNKESLQKDRAIIDIIEKLTQRNETGRDIVIDYDCSEIPDIVPAVAMLCTAVKGRSILRNVERLRIKESDRIESTCALLSAIEINYGVTIEDGHEMLAIDGKGDTLINSSKNDIVINSYNDHRIVMAAALIALINDKGVIINDANAINKSYPGFFDMLKDRLGMSVEEC